MQRAHEELRRNRSQQTQRQNLSVTEINEKKIALLREMKSLEIHS
jgi:hypothetical protein